MPDPPLPPAVPQPAVPMVNSGKWTILNKLGAVICIPLVVLLLNLWIPGEEGKNYAIPNPPPGKSGTEAVIRAQLDDERMIKVKLVLTVRNVDGWLMSLGGKYPELLKDSGFTTETFKRFGDRRKAKPGEPANSPESETKFIRWIKAHVDASKPKDGNGPPALFATWKITADEFEKFVLWDAKPPSVIAQEKVVAWNAALVDWVKNAPGSLEHSGHDTIDSLKSFLDQRGKAGYQVTDAERQLFSKWLENRQDMLRLNVAGRHFESIAPLRGMVRRINNPAGADKGDTWQTICLPDVSPTADDIDAWRQVVQTYGVENTAPISLSIRVPNTAQSVERLSTYVNEGPLADSQTFILPARSRLMQALGWTAFLGVMWFLVLVSFTTDTLRESLQDSNTEVTKWQDSPWSTSRVVFAWWLAICSGAFLYLWAMKGQLNVISGSAPMLLGISGGTLAAASFIGISRSMKKQVKSRGFLMDIISETGEAEISRLQMVVWNGVLGIVFIWQTIAEWLMPTFDSNLSALLGISATTYVGYKWTNQKQGKPGE